MKRILNTIILLLGVIILSSCTRTVSLDELREEVFHDQKRKVAQWWYIGSKEDHHYFKTDSFRVLGTTYKINHNKLILNREIPFSKLRSDWIPLPWGSPSEDLKNEIDFNLTKNPILPKNYPLSLVPNQGLTLSDLSLFSSIILLNYFFMLMWKILYGSYYMFRPIWVWWEDIEKLKHMAETTKNNVIKAQCNKAFMVGKLALIIGGISVTWSIIL
ncbi:MAG: hypothetical protein MI717_09955 [Spirochaetales bacterium]|nr:hypothetical protein [Spirochaetales bacterium]